MFLTTTILTSLLYTSLAQKVDNCPTFTACKNEMEIYKLSTCEPLMNSNATNYQACLCYYDVNYDFCFNQCPDDPVLKAEKTAFQAVLTQDCQTAKLNPKALPNPPPWQTFDPKPSTSKTTGTTSTSSRTASASPTNANKNSASINSIAGSLMTLFGIAIAL
jgi:hypothetical protein